MDERSLRAQMARAVNTIRIDAEGQRFGENTDGVGLVRDLTVNLACTVTGRRILLLGAGGASRGVLTPVITSYSIHYTKLYESWVPA